MKKLFNGTLIFTILIFAFSCSDAESNILEDQSIKKVVKSKEELNKGVIQEIFTLSDFERYAIDKNSVVSKLSGETKSEFIKSMEFRDGIITTANYVIIESELSAMDNEEFWLLFGMSKLAYEDYKEYKCTSPHNCEKRTRYICLKGC
ncbi:hypothetical protein [Bizionia sp.]|uniref:hypothetical protein n=1 Tax=Bizionia sp. TaxID=1954480 RepID=UPI003A93797D